MKGRDYRTKTRLIPNTNTPMVTEATDPASAIDAVIGERPYAAGYEPTIKPPFPYFNVFGAVRAVVIKN